uniref:GRAM domain-containing protein n=1 Tax=Panagrolaimus sp. PS1159 TaxID=55785 RepID=A0AC35G5L2_9BILA
MAAKRIFFKKNCSERMEKTEADTPSTSFFDGTSKIPNVRKTDSPPPQEPFTNEQQKYLPTDLQLLEMIKRNHDLMLLITENEHGRETSRSDNLDNLLSPLPYLRHRAQSIAVPTIAIKDSNLSSNSSLSSMNEEENAKTEKTFCKNLCDQWSDFYGQVADAFSETNDDIKAKKSPEAQKLSPNALKRDIKRCLSECQPYIETAIGLKDLFIWKNPIASLSINYFTEHKGINIGLNFLPRKEVTFKKLDYSGAQLVFDIAKKVQVILKVLADIFEKARNTCLTIIGFGFGGKAFITTYLFHRFPRLRHMFDIIIYFYDRLPTSRTENYDKQIVSKASASNSNLNKTSSSWKRSTDPLSKSQSTNNILNPVMDIRRRSIGVIPYQTTTNCVLPSSSAPPSPILNASENCSNVPSVITDNDEDLLSVSDDSSLNDIFLISRSCVMVDKERPFPFGMSSGTLILNEKMLKFRYKKLKEGVKETLQSHLMTSLLSKRMLKFRYKKLKEGVKETLQIPFDDITSVKKIRTLKTFSLIPGSSKALEINKALEIKLSTKKKAIHFIGLQKRDDFYESLIESARMDGVQLILNDGF